MRRSSRQILLAALFNVIAGVSVASAQETAETDSMVWSKEIQADLARNPLEPPDTSSPRATLQSFLDNMNRSHRVLMAAHERNLETPGVFTPAPVKTMGREAERLLERGVHCLDLSKIPISLRKRAGYEYALLLKEILDRIDLPPADLIPDADSLGNVAGEHDLTLPLRWRIPRTDIGIARVESGSRQGEYLFSPRTVSRLGEYYAAVVDDPSKTDVYTSDGFYEFFLRTPGWLMPPRWSRWLPGWSNRTFLSLTVWQWGAWGFSLLLWIMYMVGAYRRLILGPEPASPGDRYRRRALFCLGNILILVVVHIILTDEANLSGTVYLVTRLVITPIWWLLLGSLIFFVGRMLAEMIIASPRIDPEGIQASYYRALFSVLGFAGGGGAVIFGLSRLGVSLIPLLTGLGIGGLAVALAARPTLESLIGSFTIFADNPYRVGDRLNVMGEIGAVESIGLRSTRIRLLSGHLTAIPNDKMAASEIENIGRRPHIRRTFSITITYDSPPEKIKRAVEILKEILAGPGSPAAGHDAPHPNVPINQPEFKPRVYFNEFNSDSLNIYVSYWYHPPEYWDYMEHAHWVNIQIAERFKAEGIDFAFPTQTLHLAGDRKRPLNIGHRQVTEGEDG